MVLETFLARIPDYDLDREHPAKWMTGQRAGMTTVPVVFRPGRPSGNDRSAAQVWLDRAAAA